MTNKILVTYATNAGSTRAVAEAVAAELAKDGSQVDICRMEEVQDVPSYGAAVIAAPMIIGWHRSAVKFLKKHQDSLSYIPVALCFTAMSLVRTAETQVNGVPVWVDPCLPKEPKTTGRLSFQERHTSVQNYLSPVLRAVPRIKPVNAGFFGGKMDFTRLKLPQMLFAMLVVRAQPGDRRNWPAIREWAASLPLVFKNSKNGNSSE